jgi:hypothetical protein
VILFSAITANEDKSKQRAKIAFMTKPLKVKILLNDSLYFINFMKGLSSLNLQGESFLFAGDFFLDRRLWFKRNKADFIS